MSHKTKQAEQTNEEALLKALEELEESAKLSKADDEDSSSSSSASSSEKPFVKKGNIPEQMSSTKKANGGLSKTPSDDTENFETHANEEEPRTAKSLLDENEDLEKGLEVSPFLAEFANTIAEASDASMSEVRKGFDEQKSFNRKLQKAIVTMGNMIMELGGKVEDYGDQPATARKTVLNKSEVQEREFQKSEGLPQFSRAQVLSALTDMVVKGEADVDPIAVSSYESTGYLDPSLVQRVNARLVKG
jgi:hypothetical protein